jgi:hypothetical protein
MSKQKAEPKKILLTSMVSGTTLDPWVSFEWGAEKGRVTPDEAREHAWGVLQTANAAESDGFMVETLMKDAAMSIHTATATLLDFREWRDTPRTKRALVTAPPLPEKSETDDVRRYAQKLLVMAEMADAQAFLVGFLTERVGLRDAVAQAIAQKYVEYYERRQRFSDQESHREM